MTLIAESGLTVVIPFAPLDLTHSGMAGDWDTIARPRRTALVSRKGLPLEKLDFTLLVAHPDPDDPVDAVLAALKVLAGSGERVTVNYGPQESGLWRITDFSYQATGRRHGTNEITRATATLALTQTSDSATNVGPVTGGAQLSIGSSGWAVGLATGTIAGAIGALQGDEASRGSTPTLGHQGVV
jgi:hypothetical protein